MTTPQQLLSDEQIFKDWCKAREGSTRTTEQVRTFARAIESATLKALSGQEPIGYFRSMPFGWEDCAESEDGAMPLFALPPAQPAPVDERETLAQKTERNCRVQTRYDELMRAGKHGHYETMFRVVREEVEAARAALQGAQAPQPGGWLPITPQTRPVGSVLLLIDGASVAVGEYVQGLGWHWSDGDDMHGEEAATHWQPLPPAPQATKGGEA